MKRLLFLLFNFILAGSFFVALYYDTHRDWHAYQKQFFKTLTKKERRGVGGGIKQILTPDLKTVDRCTTCHLAVDKTSLALAEHPFKEHPGDLLKYHPIEKYGCTSCHAGQGLATDVAAAHGDVKFWEQPLLRGNYVQSSCRSCHGDLEAIKEYVPVLAKGKELFETSGCYGCHSIDNFGGNLSVALDEVGSKADLLIEADYEMMHGVRHNRINWVEAKLKNSRALNPGVPVSELPLGEEEVFPTAMPRFGFDEDERFALTTYLLSLKEFDPPLSYTIPAKPEPKQHYVSKVAKGKAVFAKYGCNGCHGDQGVGGRNNWNAGLAGEVPPLVYVKGYYENDRAALKHLIQYGRQPVPRADIHSPNPAIFMPAWKDKIADHEIEALIDYLFSLSELLPQTAEQATSVAQGS